MVLCKSDFYCGIETLYRAIDGDFIRFGNNKCVEEHFICDVNVAGSDRNRLRYGNHLISLRLELN